MTPRKPLTALTLTIERTGCYEWQNKYRKILKSKPLEVKLAPMIIFKGDRQSSELPADLLDAASGQIAQGRAHLTD